MRVPFAPLSCRTVSTAISASAMRRCIGQDVAGRHCRNEAGRSGSVRRSPNSVRTATSINPVVYYSLLDRILCANWKSFGSAVLPIRRFAQLIRCHSRNADLIRSVHTTSWQRRERSPSQGAPFCNTGMHSETNWEFRGLQTFAGRDPVLSPMLISGIG